MKEKIALITGASRGLGKALAQSLAQKGYCVYAGVRDVNKAPLQTIPIQLDLTNEQTMQSCVERIISEKGGIDLLINNGAIAYVGAVDSMTIQEARELFEVNFFGAFRLTQLILPHMRARKEGSILFISSIRGVESCAYMGMYSASKAALEAMAFDLAVTLAKWNISVSVVQPGPLNTGIELKQGSYFEDKENPYLPYPEVSLESQSAEAAAEAILNKLSSSYLPFRFQTNELAEQTIAKHLKDPTGMQWYYEQRQR